MRIGLYFGTFNPIHVGHLVIANYMADYTDLDRVWLVVTPQNPMKKNKELLEDYHRLAIVQEAIKDNPLLNVSNIEFDMPKPNYTAKTMEVLEEKYPQHEFGLIMGGDNLRTFDKWQDYKKIIDKYQLYVYPRPLTPQEIEELGDLKDQDSGLENHPNVHLCQAPVMKVSSTFIRQAIRDNKDVRYLLTEPVYDYVRKMQFYEE